MNIFWLIFYFIILLCQEKNASADFLGEFPQLASFLRSDFQSPFRVGFGVIPFQNAQSKAGMGITPFTGTLLNSWIEWNFFSATLSSGFLGGDSLTNYISMTFRSALKLRVSEMLSIGPVIGTEYISFSNISAQLFKNNLVSPYEPFSVNGFLFGGVLSEWVKIGPDMWLQINEMVLIQRYRVSSLTYGWTALFQNEALNQNTSAINPGTIFLIEVCILH